MSARHSSRLSFVATFLTLTALLGCGGEKKPDAGPSLDGKKFVVEAEPDGAQSVLEVRDAVQKGGKQEVVVVGRISGKVGKEGYSPWSDGTAEFWITDAAAVLLDSPDEDDHHHQPADKGGSDVHKEDGHDHGDHKHSDGADGHAASDHKHAAGHDHAHAGHAHAGHAHGGEGHENCPFCNRAKSDLKNAAIVQFLDEKGSVIKMDARKLLGLKEDVLVVVKGQAELQEELDNLLITASQIYVRQ